MIRNLKGPQWECVLKRWGINVGQVQSKQIKRVYANTQSNIQNVQCVAGDRYSEFVLHLLGFCQQSSSIHFIAIDSWVRLCAKHQAWCCKQENIPLWKRQEKKNCKSGCEWRATDRQVRLWRYRKEKDKFGLSAQGRVIQAYKDVWGCGGVCVSVCVSMHARAHRHTPPDK